jgi:hypothetical protein
MKIAPFDGPDASARSVGFIATLPAASLQLQRLLSSWQIEKSYDS